MRLSRKSMAFQRDLERVRNLYATDPLLAKQLSQELTEVYEKEDRGLYILWERKLEKALNK